MFLRRRRICCCPCIRMKYSLSKPLSMQHLCRCYPSLNPCGDNIASSHPRMLLRRQWLCRCFILVVMEYGLRQNQKYGSNNLHQVLILVVMEYGLRLGHLKTMLKVHIVLILVVMEYGLRQIMKTNMFYIIISLNPCCNGIWSQTKVLLMHHGEYYSS